MTRRYLLLLTFQVTPGYDDLRDKILEVEKHWDRFIRQFFGCAPAGEVTQETCKPGDETVDYAAFGKWWKAAKKLAQVKRCDS